MKLSRKTVYAIGILKNLSTTKPITLKEAIKGVGIAKSYAEQIMPDLKMWGFVSAKRGPGGGYLLTKPQKEISIKAIDSAVSMVVCHVDDEDANLSDAQIQVTLM